MSNRNYVVGTVVVLVVFITCLAFFASTFSALQYINPAAVFAAIAVAVAGFAWFRRSAKT